VPKLRFSEVNRRQAVSGTVAQTKGTRQRTVLKLFHYTSKTVPSLWFYVKWNAQSSVITTSQNRIVWTGAAGEELRTTVCLKHSKRKSFKILKAKATSSFIKAVDINKNSITEHTFDVVMTTKAKAGMYQEKLIMLLDDPEQKELEITIVAVLR
jgi:hypothetical protein